MAIASLLRCLFVVTTCVMLSACVSTTTSGRVNTNVDQERALETHVALALNYIESRNRESARHHLRRAFEIDRRSVDATFAMAMLYQLEGEPELAEDYFKRTLRMDRNHTRARNNYGVYLYERGRYKEAFTQFEHAANNLDYDNRAQAMMNLGRTALRLGETEKALSTLEHANRLNPNLPGLKYELAALHFDMQDYASARRFLDEYERMARPQPRTLLLGIKIERIFRNEDKEASYGLMLRNMFPYSAENLEYTRMQESD